MATCTDMKRTTTSWATQATRTTFKGPPSAATLADLDAALAARDWGSVLSDMDKMPIGIAVQVRDRLIQMIGAGAALRT